MNAEANNLADQIETRWQTDSHTKDSPISYDVWMQKVDLELQQLIGLSHDDLPDALWRDEFDAGSTPREAIENNAEQLEIEAFIN